jgi:hypothetical protein
MSATPDSTLLNPEQRIADLERQLAASRAERDEAQRQLAETASERDEALQRETATAEVLGVINASPGDLAPVFDAILEKALALCGGAFDHLNSYEGDEFRSVALRGIPDAALEELRTAWRPPPEGPLRRLVNGEARVHVSDITADPAYLAQRRRIRVFADVAGARTAVWIALRKDDVLLGALVIFRKEVRPFTDKQIALLQNFAAQAVIAMENARLINETREALEQQTATAEVLQVINSAPGDLAPMFDAVLEKAMRLCKASFGCFATFDGERLPIVAHRGVPEEFVEALREPVLPPPGSAAARIVRGEAVVQVADLSEAQTYRSAGARSPWLRSAGRAPPFGWHCGRRRNYSASFASSARKCACSRTSRSRSSRISPRRR